MSDFTSFFNNSQSFGMNIMSTSTAAPDKTVLQQVGETASNMAEGVFEPLFNYLEKNEEVFSGDISEELNKMYNSRFNMEITLSAEDEARNGAKPKFDTKF